MYLNFLCCTKLWHLSGWWKWGLSPVIYDFCVNLSFNWCNGLESLGWKRQHSFRCRVCWCVQRSSWCSDGYGHHQTMVSLPRLFCFFVCLFVYLFYCPHLLIDVWCFLIRKKLGYGPHLLIQIGFHTFPVKLTLSFMRLHYFFTILNKFSDNHINYISSRAIAAEHNSTHV